MRAGGLSAKAGSRPPRHTSAGLYPCAASNCYRPDRQAFECKKALRRETLTGAWAVRDWCGRPCDRFALSVHGPQGYARTKL